MPAYVNPLDKNQECALHGERAEKSFKEILINEGFTVKDATVPEQKTHVDFIATKNNQITRYDVKARKRVNRQDDKYQDDLIWIEIQNIWGGLGWLFGASDYIVFEREKDFVVVDRQKLADFVTVHCNLRKNARYADEALYARYQRFGRKDCLTMIRGEDVQGLAKTIYSK
jgi:dipeptidyl aminopeptidase/acylaminoacyl peptidase